MDTEPWCLPHMEQQPNDGARKPEPTYVLPEPNPAVDDWMPCTWQDNLRFWLTIGVACAGALGFLWWVLP